MTQTRFHACILFIVCAVMFWWRLGHLGLIDPDEPFYAQTTREMVEANDWITPHIFGQPQFEKPIFFYWQSMTAQKIFGDTAFAARAPSALLATGIVFLVWLFGRRMFSPLAGLLSAIVLATGMEFVLMSRLMLTDICLAFFVTLSMFGLWMAVHDESRRNRWVFLQLMASGFATLTKGPIGILFPALGGIAYLWFTRTRSPWRGRGLWLGLLAWTVIAVPWYVMMFLKFGWEYWDRFFVHENWDRIITSEHDHSNHWWYYPMILFLGTLPWIPLLAASLLRSWKDARTDRRVLFLACWFLPSLMFLTIAQSKLPSYIFFLFMPLALLMGPVLESWMQKGFRSTGERRLVCLSAIIQALGVLAAPFIRPEEAARYNWLAAIIAVPLVIAAAMLVRQQFKLAAASLGLTTALVIGLALTKVSPDIEVVTSTRTIGQKIESLRRPGEPLVTASFLTRAVNYFSGVRPAGEYSQGPRAHYTPHPLPVIVRDKGLAKFAADYPSVLCVGQLRDLEDLTRPKSVLKDRCEKLLTIGDRVIFRIIPADARPDAK